MTSLAARLDRALAALPRAYPGPGGAIAVLRDGEVLARHAWGWADAERRIAFTPGTLFRICSITKQFTCALVLDAFPDPSVLDGDVRARLPLLDGHAPGALHLCHNQSGLRDYWAVAMLHGSPAEAPFGDAQAARVVGGTRTLQFAPGTRYSYANQNFRILSGILQDRTGRSFAELLRTRIFDRAGMGSAMLAADTHDMPDGTIGYEGTQATGFRPAVNRVLWTGDAGIGASLDDMIAWERHVDAARDDAHALPSRLSAPVAFSDGTPAPYGFGLNRRAEMGRPAGLAQLPAVPARGPHLGRRDVQPHGRPPRCRAGSAGRRAGRELAAVGRHPAAAGLAGRLRGARNRPCGAHGQPVEVPLQRVQAGAQGDQPCIRAGGGRAGRHGGLGRKRQGGGAPAQHGTAQGGDRNPGEVGYAWSRGTRAGDAPQGRGG